MVGVANRWLHGLGANDGGEERAEVGERERHRREDPRLRRRAENRRQAVEVQRHGAVIVRDVVGQRQRASATRARALLLRRARTATSVLRNRCHRPPTIYHPFITVIVGLGAVSRKQ
jgi:hypothetical protein